MRASVPAALALALLAALPARARPSKAEEPVAVLPFKNLAAEASLDWLRQGIAETMVADLKRGGVQVVERDQLDRAMAEIALQGTRGTEEATAARIGKMVGARTILVGSFQSAGGQVRIVARFVAVETAVVHDAVKVTGPLKGVLGLQDQVVARLLGSEREAQVAARRPRRRDSRQASDAYRLWAMSLTTASDADRVGLLRQSLEIDPDFAYALDDLRTLEQRLRGWAAEGEKVLALRGAKAAEDFFSGSGTPEERSMQALQLVGMRQQERRWRALSADARRIMEMGLPRVGNADPAEQAAYALLLSYVQLKRPDEALQAGEQFMKRFPASLFGTAARSLMDAIIRHRFEVEGERTKAEQRLADVEKDRARLLAAKPGDHTPRRLLFLDADRCLGPSYRHLPRLVLEECRAFVAKLEGDRRPEATERRRLALLAQLGALEELGDFSAAREMGRGLVASEPDFARQLMLPYRMDSWPQD